MGITLHQLSDAYISSGKGDCGYRFEAKITDMEVYRSISVLDQISIEFSGETYSLVVINKSFNRASSASLEGTISAVSPVYLKTLPYSPTIAYIPSGAVPLSQIVSEIMGQEVIWELPDWIVPFGRAQVSDATPLDAANSMLNSLLAGIQSNPDGSLVARYTYPTNWDAVQSIAPAQTFDDSQDVISVSIGYEFRKGFNRYHLRDSDSSYGDNIDWAPDKLNNLSGVATVTPHPYRSSWTLSTTSEHPILIEELGEVLDTFTEVIEFIAGIGRAQQPIISITSMTWESTSLGGVSFDPFSTKLTANTTINDGYGLAKLVYVSKAYKFRISAQTAIESAQLIVKEN